MKITYLLLLAAAAFALQSCDNKRDADDAVNDALDNRPAEKVQDAAEDAADKVEDAADRAKDRID